MAKVPITCAPITMKYVERLNEVATQLAHDMGLAGGEHVQGAAIYAGLVARINALPGQGDLVAAASAYVVAKIASGEDARTLN